MLRAYSYSYSYSYSVAVAVAVAVAETLLVHDRQGIAHPSIAFSLLGEYEVELIID